MSNLAELRYALETIYDSPPAEYNLEARDAFTQFKHGLNSGEIRAAEPDADSPTGWRINEWVKKGILAGFRMGGLVDMSIDSARQPWIDKATYPVRTFSVSDEVRIVPGGTSIRDGAHVARGVVCMPPSYINVGAFVDTGTMIDSHALVGSCAQVGKNCHISAAAQLGGVLEPVGALPVVIEDNVLVGGNCGVYEGTVVQFGAVLASGTVLNRSTQLYDLVRGEIYSATDDTPLVVPPNAVVIPGARAITRGRGPEWGLSAYTPVIVKYRDDKTSEKAKLEDLLR